MSDRHAYTRTILQRLSLPGALAASAVVGASAITLLAGAPAQSAPSEPIRDTSVSRSAEKVPDLPKTAHHLGRKGAEIPLPSKGKDRLVKRQPSAAQVVKLAVAQVGIRENDAGGGTKFHKWFMSSPYAQLDARRDGGKISDYANAAWCDMFVSWVGQQLGVKGMGVDAFTQTHASWFKKQERWGQAPKPGAVVFFDFGDGSIDHVGLVVKDNHDGTIQTVEGNANDAVQMRTRDTSTVAGYGYPDYAR